MKQYMFNIFSWREEVRRKLEAMLMNVGENPGWVLVLTGNTHFDWVHLSLPILIHFAFQFLCTLTFLHLFRLFSFFLNSPQFCIYFSIPASIQRLGVTLLHKHFHSKEGTSDVWAQRAESVLSRTHGSVRKAEGFPREDPRGAQGYATPLKHCWALIVFIWAVT